MKSGCPEGAYVNQAPKRLLPCCASVRPHPDSAEFHQRSVWSIPQLGAALPKGRRSICFVRASGPTLQVKRAGPPAAPAGAKSNEAVPTFDVTTAPGLKGPANEGPVVRERSPMKKRRSALNLPPGPVNQTGEPPVPYA